MKLGVVAALRRELGSTLDALPKSDVITFRSKQLARIMERPPFFMIAAGVGVQRAKEATQLLLTEELHGLLSVGLCGALDDSLSPCDLILGGTREFESSPSLLDLAKRSGTHRIGTIHTADHVVNDPEERRSIARTTGAIAVDMEAAAVGKVASDRGLPFLCVKVVLDTPLQPLASSYKSVGRVALDILKRPTVIGRMIGDGKRAKRAAERLRDFFLAFRKELAP